MRRIPAAALAALLIVIMLALAGCSSWFSNPSRPANDAIATANAHLKKAAASGQAVSEAASGLDSTPYTKEGASSALQITAKVREDLATQKSELAAAKAAMDSIAAMDVSTGLKEYAKLESTAIATRVKVTDLGTKLYAETDKLYEALQVSELTPEQTQKLLDGVETIKRDITAVSEMAAQQSQAASDYFIAQKLGG